jgi:hypothetical protein
MDIDESIVHGREIKTARDRITQAGIELRAGIDTETVRGLQLINGGMAAGLVTMLPSIIRDPGYREVGTLMIVGIFFAALGLVAAIVHNRLRRKCSLEYSKKVGRQLPYKNRFLVLCQTVPNEPHVCTSSAMIMWASVAFFLLGAVSVGFGFMHVRATVAEPTAPCWELRDVDNHMLKFNRCTGRAEAWNRPQ